ncbi:14045_t:CDS:2, partial [Entrophospora sp. SA101]
MLDDLADPIGSFLKENNPQLLEKIDRLLEEKKDLLALEIDIDKFSSLAQELGITSIPTTFLFFQEKVIK